MAERERPYVPPIAHPSGIRPGFYKRKLVAGGVWVPVRILYEVTPDPDFPDNIQDRSPTWTVLQRGAELTGDRVGDVWLACYGSEITEAEYNYLMDLHAWAAEREPDDAHASPREPIDLNKMPSLF